MVGVRPFGAGSFCIVNLTLLFVIVGRFLRSTAESQHELNFTNFEYIEMINALARR
jgi:hypothetical protein